ncbi:MAG: PEP-CTERM sorting domain-containing protein [Nostoc sp.]
MKMTNLGLLVSAILGSFLLSLTSANAVILVEPIVTTPNKNFPDGEGLGNDFRPLNDILASNAPDVGNLQNLLNDTGYTINQLSLLLLTNIDFIEEKVEWGDVNGDSKIGLSNIFSNITIAPDLVLQDTPFPRLDLTDGIISDGNRFTLQFITSPDLSPVDPQKYGPLVTGVFYDGFKSVPEPSTILGFTLVIALGLRLRLRNSK